MTALARRAEPYLINGALVLATSLVLTLRSFRSRFAEVPQAAAPAARARHEQQELLTGKPQTSSVMR